MLDLRAVSEFTVDGRFVRWLTREPPFVIGVLDIRGWQGGLAFGRDIVDHGDGRRALETWRLSPAGDAERVRVDSLPQLPIWRGRPVRGAYVGQAEPLWTAHGACGYVSDGSGDFLLRIHLSSGRMDTLALPARPLVRRTSEDAAFRERLRRTGASVGMITGSGDVQPTAPEKWVALTADEQGFLWLTPWRSRSSRGRPRLTLAIDPGRGVVDSLMATDYPWAFVDGGFVTLGYDSDLGVRVLRKYVAVTEGRGTRGRR